MFRHVRMVLLVALVAAVAIGLLLPGPHKTDKKSTQISQIPLMSSH